MGDRGCRVTEDWRVHHRAVQRALSELEGTEYVEPQPRWMRFATNTQPLNRFMCPACPRTFKALDSLKRHTRNFHGGKQ